MAVADAVLRDAFTDGFRQSAHKSSGQVFFFIEQWKRAFLARQLYRSLISRVTDALHGKLRDFLRFTAAVADLQHDQRIGQPRQPQTDTARAPRLSGLAN